MQINQHNYEAFFLMYVDNELSLHQKEMVHTFIAQNPKLANELELLKQTVSAPDETIHFVGKEKLMNRTAFTEEDLLTYLDGEADAQMIGEIETSLQHNNELKLQISKLKKLYLSGDDRYVYPRKKDLYRHTPVRRMDWRKMAVAASLLICVSSWLFLYKSEEDVVVPIAQIDTTQQPEMSPTITEDTATPQVSAEPETIPQKQIEPTVSKKEATDKKEQIISSQKKAIIPTAPVEMQTVINKPPVDKIKEKEPLKELVNVDDIKIMEKQTATMPVAESKTQTAFEEEPAKEKKPSFLKKIGKIVGDRALDILSDGGDNIYVAGFAINVDR